MKHTIIILALLLLAGCGMFQKKQVEQQTTDSETVTITKEIIKEVYKVNKVATLYFLVIAIGGYFIAVGPRTVGVGLVVAGGAGLSAMAIYQRFATHPWLPTGFAVTFLVGGVAYLGWREYNRFKSMKAAVMYAELKKNKLSPEKIEELKKLQTKPVNKIIEEVKSTI